MTNTGVYGKREGIVIRIQDEFPVNEFHKSVIKIVRKIMCRPMNIGQINLLKDKK